jgi:predicted metalloprotease with PDZ domain
MEVFLPVWTPGSYLVREYARNIEAISVTDGDGNPLRFEKSRKNRWRIDVPRAREIRLSYQVYCREMSVRTNWVEDSFALLNGAPTFITRVDGLHLPHEVQLELPARWKISLCGLPETAPHRFSAVDYHELVDSPILAGNPSVYRFEVDGIRHFLANLGEEAVWDGPRSAADVERLVLCPQYVDRSSV